MNHENEAFSYNCRNVKCKNHVGNVSKNVTSTRPNKNKLKRTETLYISICNCNNTDEGDNGLNTGSASNYSTPNRNNTNNTNSFTPLKLRILYWSPTDHNQREIYNHKTSSSPAIEVTEKTHNTEILKEQHPNSDRKTVSGNYPPNNSHCDTHKSLIKKKSLENQIDLPNTNSDMVKHELRVAIYWLWVENLKARVEIPKHEFKSTSSRII